MANESDVVREYIKAVGRHWWAIVTGLVLTLLDGAERLLGTWYLPPLWAKIATAVAGLVLAQYLAYRELAQSRPNPISNFKDRLREVFRAAELEWSQTTAAEYVPAPVICNQIDGFSAELAKLYSQSPPSWDSQPLRHVIEKLRATKNLRVGNNIPSLDVGNQICEQMDAALADV